MFLEGILLPWNVFDGFCFLAMFPERLHTRKHCFLAMFPEGGQTRKHCFLAMFPERLQTIHAFNMRPFFLRCVVNNEIIIYVHSLGFYHVLIIVVCRAGVFCFDRRKNSFVLKQ